MRRAMATGMRVFLPFFPQQQQIVGCLVRHGAIGTTRLAARLEQRVIGMWVSIRVWYPWYRVARLSLLLSITLRFDVPISVDRSGAHSDWVHARL